MLLVIIGHTTENRMAKELIYSFHIPLFFICSGMTYRFSFDVREFWEKARRGFLRLILPVLALYLITVLYAGAVDGCFENGRVFGRFLGERLLALLWFSGNDVMVGGLSIRAVGVVWFFMALYIARLLWDAVHLRSKERLGLWSLALTVAGVLIGRIVWLPLSLDVALAGVGFLQTGYLIKGWLARRVSGTAGVSEIAEVSGTAGVPGECATGAEAVRPAAAVRMGLIYLTGGAGLLWLALFAVCRAAGGTALDMAMRRYPLFPLCYLAAVCGAVCVLGISAALGRWRPGEKALAFLGRNSHILLFVHYMAYLPYLYYGGAATGDLGRCLLRLAVELGIFGLVMAAGRLQKGWALLGFLLPVLVQLAYLVLCRYPGTLQYDFLDQMNQVLTGSYSTHHPVFHTVLLLAAYRTAQLFGGGATEAVLLFAVFQILVCGQMVSYVVATLREAGVSRGWLTGILLLYTFYPYHFFFAGYMNKDTLFAYAVVIFTVALYRTARGMGDERGNLFHLALGGLGFALLRSNGFLALLAVAAALLLFRIDRKKRLLLAVLVVLCASFLMKQSLRLFPQIEGVEFSESLSIPIQQVSRVIYEGCELTQEQEDLCNRLCDVSLMTGDTFVAFVRDNYNPWRSDEIKGQIQFWGRDDYLREHVGEYAALWMELGRKYPGQYLDAWVKMTSGYWGFKGGSNDYHHAVYENDLGIRNRILLPELNEAVNKILLAFQKNRVLRIFLRIGLHFWLMVGLFLLAWRQRKGNAILCVPSLAIVLTLLVATPLNGEPRYVYLMYATLPFAAAVILRDGRRVDGEQQIGGHPSPHLFSVFRRRQPHNPVKGVREMTS